MSYWVECDWCGGRLREEDERAVMCIEVKRPGDPAFGPRDVRQTRHFCVTPREDRDRMGLPDDLWDEDETSCYGRAIAAMTPKGGSAPPSGYRWVLEADKAPAAQAPSSGREMSPRVLPAPDAPPLDEDLQDLVTCRLGSARAQRALLRVLPGMGVTTVEGLREMSDEALLSIDGVGAGTVRHVREIFGDVEPPREIDQAALDPRIAELHIDELLVDRRTHRALRSAGLINVRDLQTGLRFRTLIEVYGLSQRGVDQIEVALVKLAGWQRESQV